MNQYFVIGMYKSVGGQTKGTSTLKLIRMIFITFALFSVQSLIGQKQIAVARFKVQGISNQGVEILTDRLIIELFKTKKFRVLEREMLDKIIAEQKFQLSGCNSDECLVDLGEIANVQQIIGGSIGKIGNLYSISARIIDVETGELVRTAVFDNEGDISLLLTKGMKDIAAQLSYSDRNLQDDTMSEIGINSMPTAIEERNIHNEPQSSVEIKMVKIEGGTFTTGNIWGRGTKYDSRKHQARVSDYYMSAFEITHSQFMQFLNSRGITSDGKYNGNRLINLGDSDCAIEFSQKHEFIGNSNIRSIECPIVEISWYGAIEFCNWLSEENDLQPVYSFGRGSKILCDWSATGFRLPTEAEWEYAARSGGREDRKWSGTNVESNVGKFSWNKLNSNNQVHEVGTKKPNELGIYDLSGNVFEWCWDEDPPPKIGVKRAIHGGGWTDTVDMQSSAVRAFLYPYEAHNNIGFRIVRSN